MNATAELEVPARDLLDAPIEKRIAWVLADAWVHTPHTKAAFQWMEYLLRSGRSIRPTCLQLISESGMGKTATLQTFAASHAVQATEDPLRLQRPVLFAECKPDPGGAAGVRHAILRSAWPGAKYFQCTELEVDMTLHTQGVRLLLIDELGELTKSGRAFHQKALSELKRISNILRINIVASTVLNLAHVLDIDPQFASRFKRKITLPPWSLSQDLRNFVYGLECNLPFSKRSFLDGPKLLPWLAQYGEGNTKEIVDLIRLAALYALDAGANNIQLDHLKAAKDSELPPAIVIETSA